MKVTNQTNFAMLPEWVLYSDVSPNAVRLYAVLNRYADKDTHKAKPSRKRLAGHMKVSVRTVDRCLDELTGIGAVTIKDRWQTTDDGKQRQTSNWYVVNQTPDGATQMAIGGDTSVAPPSDTHDEGPLDAAVAPKNESQKEPEPHEREKPLAPAARERDPLFEAVAEVCGIDWHNGLTKTARGQIATAVKQLKDAGASAAAVRFRAANWPSLFERATLTPTALAKHWPMLAKARVLAPRKDRFVEMGNSLQERINRVGEEGANGQPGGIADEARRSLPEG